MENIIGCGTVDGRGVDTLERDVDCGKITIAQQQSCRQVEVNGTRKKKQKNNCNQARIPLTLSEWVQYLQHLNNTAFPNHAVVSAIDKKCCVMPQH